MLKEMSTFICGFSFVRTNLITMMSKKWSSLRYQEHCSAFPARRCSSQKSGEYWKMMLTRYDLIMECVLKVLMKITLWRTRCCVDIFWLAYMYRTVDTCHFLCGLSKIDDICCFCDSFQQNSLSELQYRLHTNLLLCYTVLKNAWHRFCESHSLECCRPD